MLGHEKRLKMGKWIFGKLGVGGRGGWIQQA
jgi:hypothetical protein